MKGIISTSGRKVNNFREKKLHCCQPGPLQYMEFLSTFIIILRHEVILPPLFRQDSETYRVGAALQA